jgi:hypothetical protein
MAADDYAVAVQGLPPAAQGLLGAAGPLRERVSELAEFAFGSLSGDNGRLVSRLPQTLLDPRIGELLEVIAVQLALAEATDQKAVAAAVRDMVLSTSLMPAMTGRSRSGQPVTATMNVLAPEVFVQELNTIASLLLDGRRLSGSGGLESEPRYLAQLGYAPGQPLGERLARLTWLNLRPVSQLPNGTFVYPRGGLARDPLFVATLTLPADQGLAAVMYAGGGPVTDGTGSAAEVSRQLGARLPFLSQRLTAAEVVLDLAFPPRLPQVEDLRREIRSIRRAAEKSLLDSTPMGEELSPEGASQELLPPVERWTLLMQAIQDLLAQPQEGQAEAGGEAAERYRALLGQVLAAPLTRDRLT